MISEVRAHKRATAAGAESMLRRLKMVPRKSQQAHPFAIDLWSSLDAMMRCLKFGKSKPMRKSVNFRQSQLWRSSGRAIHKEGDGHITSAPKLHFCSTILPSRNGRILLKTKDRRTRYPSQHCEGAWMLFLAVGIGFLFKILRALSVKPAPFATKEIHAETH